MHGQVIGSGNKEQKMEPIDKIIIRVIILTLGSIFGITAVQNANSVGEIAKSIKKTHTYSAGLVPLPEKK